MTDHEHVDHDIVFSNLEFRDPVRQTRPDRDPHLCCATYGTPRSTDLPIFFDRTAAAEVERHGTTDTSVELGGLLLGKECCDPETGEPFVLISRALRALHYENSQTSFTYTHNTWEALTRQREQQHPELDIVGWYHTHPDFGVFLSGHDLFLHQHFFGQPLQVAFVLDPVRQTRGVFFQQGQHLVQAQGYHLTDDRTHRVSLARFVNQLEHLPNPEAGGFLPPELEAELMAVLSTKAGTPTAQNRSPTGPIFLTLGLILGLVLAMLAGGCLYLVRRELRDQSTALANIAREHPSGSTESSQMLAARERVVNALLVDVKIGSTAESVGAKLQAAYQQVDSLRTQLSKIDLEHEGLVELTKQARLQLAQQTAALTSLQNRYDRLEQEKRLLESLPEREPGPAPVGNPGSGLPVWLAISGWLAFGFALLGILALRYRRSDWQNAAEPGAWPDPVGEAQAATIVHRQP